MQMEESFCDVAKKPTSKTDACNEGDCLAPFYWKATHGKCISKCGLGRLLNTSDLLFSKASSSGNEYLYENGHRIKNNIICIVHLMPL